MKTQSLFVVLTLAALLACKKKEQPTPTPIATSTSTAAPEAAADTWTVFKSDAGKFEIRTPAEMKSQTDPTETAAGDVDNEMFTAKYDSTAFQVAYADMPAKVIRSASAKKLLKGGEDGAMKAINATAESSKELEVEGYPAREYSTVATAEGVELDYYGRAILVKNRLYQIQVIGPKGRVSAADRTKFVDSFKLVK